VTGDRAGDRTGVLADGGGRDHELLHHLLIDYALKVGIVLVALVVLGVGMAVLWRRVGAGPPRRQSHQSADRDLDYGPYP